MVDTGSPLHRKFPAEVGVHPDVPTSSLGSAVEPAAKLPADAPPARRSAPGAPRAPRRARVVDRRTALSTLAAELSAAAATIDEPGAVAPTSLLQLPEHPVMLDREAMADAPASATVLERLATLDDEEAEPLRPAEPELPVEAAAMEMTLTGRREDATATAPTAADPTDVEALRTAVELEVARAKADVLSDRVEAELAARTTAERRLAEAEDEIRFLRAEVQMSGHTPQRPPGTLRRLLLAITGRRRPVVPANNPKKDNLGA